MILSLPDVTLCAVTAVNHELTVRAMKECLKHCSFADVVLITDKPVDAPFRVELIPPFQGQEYARIVCQDLAKYTPSAFNLLVQYDGYIVDPLAWSDRFLDYDYIGAKWPWQPENRRVGNSGFCLRSKKLLDIMARHVLPPLGTYVDDTYICHTIREQLERDFNIQIAPDDIADRFSFERHMPDQPTFGFHGMFNFWRYTPDEEMIEILNVLDELYVQSRPYAEIVFHYYVQKKWNVFNPWYYRLRQHNGGAAPLHAHLLNYIHNPEFIEELIKTGEASLMTRS